MSFVDFIKTWWPAGIGLLVPAAVPTWGGAVAVPLIVMFGNVLFAVLNHYVGPEYLFFVLIAMILTAWSAMATAAAFKSGKVTRGIFLALLTFALPTFSLWVFYAILFSGGAFSVVSASGGLV